MNELIAMYALNYVVDNTVDGREKVLEVLSDEEIEMFAAWAEKSEIDGDDIMNGILQTIKNKIKELKGE